MELQVEREWKFNPRSLGGRKFHSSHARNRSGLRVFRGASRENKAGHPRGGCPAFIFSKPVRAALILATRLAVSRSNRNQVLVRRADRLEIAESANEARLRWKFPRANQVRHFRDFLFRGFQCLCVPR